MEIITAEQAIESSKDLTFEKVWAALMETRKNMEEFHQKTEKSLRKTEKLVADVTKNLGGLGNSLGRLTEALFSSDLCKKFNEIGFMFNEQSRHKEFYQDGNLIAEVDSLLENGEYIMLLKIKTELSVSDVDDHIERIEKIRQYMDTRNDDRILVGAAAGGFVPKNVLKYAQKKGIFVVIQTGEAVAIADLPQGFIFREWKKAV